MLCKRRKISRFPERKRTVLASPLIVLNQDFHKICRINKIRKGNPANLKNLMKIMVPTTFQFLSINLLQIYPKRTIAIVFSL